MMKRFLALPFLALLALASPALAQFDELGSRASYTPDRSASGALGALDAAVTITLNGRQGVGGYVTTGTLSGTVIPEVTIDGTNWLAARVYNFGVGVPASATSLTLNTNFGIEIPPGAKQARIRVSVYTSGTSTGTLVATAYAGNSFQPTQAVSGTGTFTVGDGAGALNVILDSGTVTSIGTNVVPGTGAADLGKAEDAAHTSADVGTMALAVRRDVASSLTNLDNDYLPLTTDNAGRVWVNASGATVPVNLTQIGGGTIITGGTVGSQAVGGILAHDAPMGGNNPILVGGFASATAPTSVAGSDMVRAWYLLNGIQAVNLRDAAGAEVAVGGGTQYDEDTVSVAADKITMAGVVRVDTPGTLAGTDGDRTQLQVDAAGALRVTGGGGGTEYVVNAVTPADPTGTTTVMERDDALSALTEIEGDWTNFRGNANGALWAAIDGSVAVTGTFWQATQPVSGTVTVTDGAGALNVIVDSSALPSGASTLAEQQTQTTALQKIDNIAHSGADVALVEHVPVSAQFDDVATTAVTENQIAPARITSARALHVAQQGSVTVTDGAGALNTIVDSGSLTANAGTNLNTSALALEAGGNLATIAGAVKAEDVASAGADPGVVVNARRTDTPANQSGLDGDYEPLQISGGRLHTSTVVATALPAGTNNIGDVDVLTLPALVAGTANIGDVDVLTLPALVAGTANIGDVDVLTFPDNEPFNAAQWGGTAVVNGGTAGTVAVGGIQAEGAAPSGNNPIPIAGRARDGLPTAEAAGDLMSLALDRFGHLRVVAVKSTMAQSNGTPVTATTANIVAAPSAGNHLRIVRITGSNGSATKCWLGWREGAAGLQKYRTWMMEGSVVSFRLDGSWELPTATALDLVLSAACSIEYQVEYISVVD